MRFGTGDLSAWTLAADGTLRLAGVLGRVGEAVKVRGIFLHPHQAAEVLQRLHDDGAASGRFVVDRDGDRDVLRLEVVAEAGSDRDRLVDSAVSRTREVLRLRPDVRVVDADADIGDSGDAVRPGGSVLVDARTWD